MSERATIGAAANRIGGAFVSGIEWTGEAKHRVRIALSRSNAIRQI